MQYIKSNPFSWIVFVCLLLATWFQVFSIWGALFMWWAVSSFMTGQAFLIETIDSQENPPLFYAITTMWFLFGLLYVVQDLAWRLFGIYIG
ncbi:hypothetical protein [Ruegeria sp. R14_0]|uniref:hypothetical protein n=1 Tax=Ruegeria sp. R14_0 TaxID=2821100 RepID=UPI001AD9C81D|nr:hypothetical protein [Ruegeria sp. R14_0]MBO9446900.1 hypothetical protein [Ruegeria sp. R14_0]